MLHEGGQALLSIGQCFKQIRSKWQGIVRLQFVLFGFTCKLASHLARSPLIHSLGYESAGDRATCLANLPLNSESFMQHPG